MKLIFLTFITWIFCVNAQEERLEENPDHIEVLKRFPRFRVEYNFKKVAKEVKAEIESTAEKEKSKN